MTFTISDGTEKDIIVGSVVTLVPGYLPSFFDGKQLVVTKLQVTNGVTYPYVLFTETTSNGTLLLNQESAVSPEIIKDVI